MDRAHSSGIITGQLHLCWSLKKQKIFLRWHFAFGVDLDRSSPVGDLALHEKSQSHFKSCHRHATDYIMLCTYPWKSFYGIKRKTKIAFLFVNWGKSLHYFNLSNLLLQMKTIFNNWNWAWALVPKISILLFPPNWNLPKTMNIIIVSKMSDSSNYFVAKKGTKVAACIREVAATFVVKTRQLSKKSPQESYRLGVNLTTLWNDLKFWFLKKNWPLISLGQEISKRN